MSYTTQMDAARKGIFTEEMQLHLKVPFCSVADSASLFCRYFAGEMPVCPRKHFIKQLTFEKPTRSAISAIFL